MGYLKYDDVKQIWYETPAQNWYALRQTLQSHAYIHYDGLDDIAVARAVKTVGYLENSEEPYPASADELYAMLYQYR
jgi:hypothetical protein